MNPNISLKLNMRWDQPLLPAGQPSDRNLLIEVETPEFQNKERVEPLNLVLVIDRSGSMAQGRLRAACIAAQNIAERLTRRDRLSVVVFDDYIDTLIDGAPMDRYGKQSVGENLRRVFARGSTNLGGGWFEGARCAAGVIEHQGIRSGHVLILSDGRANKGVCSPDELKQHAKELAARGITTSAVGIGNHYSPIQLDALAEGGGGRLHDAEILADIADIVVGELQELSSIVAHGAELTVTYPSYVKVELLSGDCIGQDTTMSKVSLRDLAADTTRRVALRVEVPPQAVGTRVPFDVVLTCRDVESERVIECQRGSTELHVVPLEQAKNCLPDQGVVEVIADLWEASIAYQALLCNEQQDYAGARALYATREDIFSDYVKVLDSADERVERYSQFRERVSAEFSGRSKAHVYSGSKKAVRQERDLRRRDTGDWRDLK